MVFVYIQIETFFSSEFNAMLYCSSVTPHFSKISNRVTLDKSSDFTIYERTFLISLLLAFYLVSSKFCTELTLLVSTDGGQEA